MKELSDKLFATLNQSQALPETAKVFSKYQDALNETPIPVNNGGYILGQAVVGDTDTNIQLEVSLDEDHYIDAETIIPSNNLTSSDATGTTLKSCPEKVFVLPGEVIIIQISSTTGINLKESGLTFSIKNSSLGCITSKPIFLEICGKRKYEKAYCLFYAKKNLTTPIDTVITAKTSNGLQLEIFTEIIKSSASISGKVFTGGKPLIKGYVKSIGPKAFCKLDSSGNYTLPRVFRGHFRKIIATYWIEDNNGKKIRHREEKIIDFFNSNLTNFNFGEEPTPTPTSTPTATPTPRSPYDSFYDRRICEVYYEYLKWENELGTELAVQKTVAWLNNEMSEAPPIPNEIIKASIDKEDNTAMWINFNDGHGVRIAGKREIPIWTKNGNITLENIKLPKLSKNIHSQAAQTVHSNKILILAPYVWEEENIGLAGIDTHRVYSRLGDYLKGLKDDDGNSIYDVHRVITRKDDAFFADLYYDPNVPDPIFDPNSTVPTPIPGDLKYKLVQRVLLANTPSPGQERNYIIPDQDFRNMNQYGIIYIATHGNEDTLACGYLFENVKEITDFVTHNKQYIPDDPNTYDGVWTMEYRHVSNPDLPPETLFKTYYINYNFFKNEPPLSDSIVYIDACQSFKLWYKGAPFNTAKVYFGHNIDCNYDWSRILAFKIFCSMMFGGLPTYSDTSSLPPPKSVRDAYNVYSNPQDPEKRINPDPTEYHNPSATCKGCYLNLYTGENGENDNTYFPVPVTITIQKK